MAHFMDTLIRTKKKKNNSKNSIVIVFPCLNSQLLVNWWTSVITDDDVITARALETLFTAVFTYNVTALTLTESRILHCSDCLPLRLTVLSGMFKETRVFKHKLT